MTASLLKSPELSVFWLISTILSSYFQAIQSLCQSFGDLPSAPITIAITIAFMFHSFFQFSSKVEVLISLFAFLQFHPVISRNAKVQNSADSLLLVDYH